MALTTRYGVNTDLADEFYRFNRTTTFCHLKLKWLEITLRCLPLKYLFNNSVTQKIMYTKI